MDIREIARMAAYEMQHGQIDDEDFREMEAEPVERAAAKPYSRIVFRDPLGGTLASHYERLAR